ncbi:MAG: WYL domain-containing protein [Coriobacteriales bacterium]|nr:WYL domain-containing protein [Coriobacteriales bacterium]
MVARPKQKLKLLHTLRILFEKTDDTNSVTTEQIIQELAMLGIDAERKSVYTDLETLREFGYDIRRVHGKSLQLATRPFQLQELILLIDAVQSSPFLTDDMTDHLIERIQELASAGQRKQLAKRVEVPGRVKMQNESVFSNLDIIQRAMQQDRKLRFRYFNYNFKGQEELRRHGDFYVETPVKLIYADGYYYLITYSDYWSKQPDATAFPPYRVDRMLDVQVSTEPATHDPAIANFKLEDYATLSFGVFAANKVTVMLEFQERAMNLLVDKFGADLTVYELEGGLGRAIAKVPLSPQFYGWLLQLRGMAKLTYPPEAVTEFKQFLDETRALYD